MGKPSRTRARPGTVRIIGGRWRGRRLALVGDSIVRPTPDRVRETLFNWLAPMIEGARCLDLYAGSGVLGIEALSRGAASTVFVERDARQAAALLDSLAVLGAPGMVIQTDVDDYLANPPTLPFDVAFIDPPYDEPLRLAGLEPFVAATGYVYCERPVRSGLPAVAWGRWHRRATAGSVAFGLLMRDDASANTAIE